MDPHGWIRAVWVLYYLALIKYIYQFHSHGSRAGDLPRWWKIQRCWIFSAPHCKSAWGIPENDVTQMRFPVYRHVPCKFVTYNHLIICKYGKQNTINDGRAHRACSVEPWFVQPNEKDAQRPNLDKKCVAQNF